MRVCAYYPVKIVTYNELSAKETIIDNGFEDDFIGKITLGIANDNDENPYILVVPSIPELSEANIIKNINRLKNFRKNVQ